MRIYLDLQHSPAQFRFLVSMNAALVAGLCASGLESATVVGESAVAAA